MVKMKKVFFISVFTQKKITYCYSLFFSVPERLAHFVLRVNVIAASQEL